IGSSLEAAPRAFVDNEYITAMEGVDPAELFITSGAELKDGSTKENGFQLSELPGITILPETARGNKCARCWKVLEEVGSVKAYDDLCRRCAEVVAKLEATKG
ncbi:MAG: zinc finger domain-containing protein, partial [Alphaproteobacteria bacterium]